MNVPENRDVGNDERIDIAGAPEAPDPVDELAEDFMARFRRGESPRVEEYVARHPELARDIEKLFPAILMLERARPVDERATACDPPRPRAPVMLGPYRLIRPIGRGGMGLVYEAVHTLLGRHVALKLLPPEIEPGSQRRVRFERESRAAALLHHSNIVPVFDVGQHDGWCYYAMQLVAGVSLADVIRALQECSRTTDGAPGLLSAQPDSPPDSQFDSPFSRQFETSCEIPANGSAMRLVRRLRTGHWAAADGATNPQDDRVIDETLPVPGCWFEPHCPYWHGVARIGLQVALALQHAHEHGILHRDIKPGNLLLDEFGAVWVVDFGLVKFDTQNDLTRTGEWLGTLRYLPPEVFDDVYDARGDVYSLGLTLYELVALEPALGHSTKSQLVAHLVRDDPVRLERLRPTVARDLSTIIHKAIERDPARRYATAAEFAADLRRFLSDRPIHARPISGVERLVRWSRRNRGLAASLLALAVSLVLFGGGAIVAAMTYYRIAGENRTLAEHERVLSRQVGAERDRKQIALADMYCNYGLEQAEQGHQREALLWFVRAAETSVNDSHSRRMNEIRMVAWHDRLSKPYCQIPGGGVLERWQFHPDGRCLLGQSTRCEARPLIWDLHVSRPIELPAACGSVTGLTWSTDGSRLAVGNNQGRLTLCQFPSLEVIETSDVRGTSSLEQPRGIAKPTRAAPRPATLLAFSPDDTRLAVADDQAVRIWECRRHAFASDAITCAKRPVDLLFSPGGQHLLVTDDAGGVTAFAVDSPRELARVATDESRQASHERSHERSQAGSHDESRGESSGYSPLWTAQLDWTAHWVRCRPQFDESGRNAIIARTNGRITWIQVDDGQVSREITHRPGRHAPPFEVTTNPRRTQLAVASHECGIDIYSTADGAHVGSLPNRGDMAVCFSSDGERLHVGGANREAKTWKLDDLVGADISAVHSTGFLRLTASQDDKFLVTVGYDGATCVWRLPEPVARRLPAHGQPAHYRGWFSRDAKFVFVRQEGVAVTVHDVMTGRPMGQPMEPRGELIEARSSPDDRVVSLLAAQEDGSFEVECRDWRTGAAHFPPVRLVGNLVHDLNNGWYLPDELQFSPDGASVYVLLRGSLTRIDARTGAVRWRQVVPSDVERLQIGPDGRLIACQGGPHIDLLDAVSGQRLQRIPARALSVAISRDGRWIAYGGDEGLVRFWNVDTQAEDRRKLTHPSWVEDVDLSSDGRLVLTRCKDHGVRVWDRAAGSLAGTPLLFDEPCAAMLTSDGRFIATASVSGTVDLWDARDGKRVLPSGRASSPYQNQVFNGARNIQVSQDGRWLVVGGRGFNAFLFRLDLTPPNLPDDLRVQRQWAELLSHSRLNSQEQLERLTESDWADRWKQLETSRFPFVGDRR